jgi:hypothetical protein
MFRDAKLANLIDQSPCVLGEHQLGPVTDKDPEWRNEAVFARAEVKTVIFDARIHPIVRSSTGSSCSLTRLGIEVAGRRWPRSHCGHGVRRCGRIAFLSSGRQLPAGMNAAQ